MDRKKHHIISQSRAISLVSEAVRKGLLLDLKHVYVKCADCDARATVYDHRDYNEPLEVIAVCKSCNFTRGSAKVLTSESVSCISTKKRLKKQIFIDRRTNIIKLFKSGLYSLEAIGRMQTPPITRQRVHQILHIFMTPYQKKRRERSDERIRAMKALYETGLFSLAQIGKQQIPPITRQRVHQLLRAK